MTPKELEAQEEKTLKDMKRKRKWILAALALVAVVGSLIAYNWWCSRPLDRIQDYQVDVAVQQDGTMNIVYHLRWEVLDSDREGALSWVKLGMGNEDFEVLDCGGAADYVVPSGSYAKVYLDKYYYEGEVAEFWISIRQNRMLCNDPDNSAQLFYDFVPGWFNAIDVEHYLFTWMGGTVASHNADRTWENGLVWEGSLKREGTREMLIYYDKEQFSGAKTVTWEPFSKEGGGGDTPHMDGQIVMIILMLGGIGIYNIFTWGEDYRRGRGYRGRHYGHGGRSGGCACACAGCACACACAGGGRAGCSNKDFYNKKEEPD